jgi:response regulator RpfG family c-di-GMP phosphodiesterase
MQTMPLPASASTTSPRCLVVEDDPAVRAVCVRLLRLNQYQVEQAANGAQALQQLETQLYDIVLTDLNMPVLDGLELLRQIKARFPSVDVIMITAFASIDTARQALKLGAFDYLTKPLELDELERTIQTCLESRELKRLRQERETWSEMMALMELSRTISTKLELSDQAHDFMNQLWGRFHPKSIALSLLDPSERTVRLLAQRGILDDLNIKREVNLPGIWCDETVVRAHIELVQHHQTNVQMLQVLHVQERPVGVLHMIWAEDDPLLDSREIQLLEVFTSSMAVALENSRLYEKLKQQNLQTIAALAAAIDARDPYTRGHSEQVTTYAVRIAEAMELPAAFIERLRYSALLHDIGKIGVPDAILLKPSYLTAEETALMRQHAAIGAQIVEQALGEVAPIIRHHHEAYDGSGYPDGLEGEAIPLEARIIAVADAFDTMTSDRAYRRAMPVTNAFAVLRAGRDKQWQGEVVDLLIKLIESEAHTLLIGKARAPQAPLWQDGAEPRD